MSLSVMASRALAVTLALLASVTACAGADTDDASPPDVAKLTEAYYVSLFGTESDPPLPSVIDLSQRRDDAFNSCLLDAGIDVSEPRTEQTSPDADEERRSAIACMDLASAEERRVEQAVDQHVVAFVEFVNSRLDEVCGDNMCEGLDGEARRSQAIEDAVAEFDTLHGTLVRETITAALNASG